jgi:chorismate mutase/prephenate dehydratase
VTKERQSREPRPVRRAKTASLPALRAQIDEIDQELLERLNARATLAVEIARLKAADGLDTFAPGREDHVIERAITLSQGPLEAESVRAIFREVISGARQLEKKLRVAYLGPMHSYSHLATLHRFGEGVELVAVPTIAAVFEEVHRRHVDYGLVPIENSTDGRIADTLDMFTRLRVRICSEVPLHIHHTLLAKCKQSEVLEVQSKPQALSQCRNWLARHLPQARLVEVTSTSHAAEQARDTAGVAAIASAQAGAYYGLDVLAANIEDNPDNMTRFAVIGLTAAPRSGRDKTAAMFEIAHRPGSLSDAIAIFKRNKLNLTWIESFPIARGEYLFFIELEGHEEDTAVRKALATLRKKTLRLEILGSYPRGEAVG